MKLARSREEEAFADEARTWLNEHLVGEFAQCRGVGGPADDDAWDVRIAWERELPRRWGKDRRPGRCSVGSSPTCGRTRRSRTGRRCG